MEIPHGGNGSGIALEAGDANVTLNRVVITNNHWDLGN